VIHLSLSKISSSVLGFLLNDSGTWLLRHEAAAKADGGIAPIRAGSALACSFPRARYCAGI
jgi:hypothetical protein